MVHPIHKEVSLDPDFTSTEVSEERFLEYVTEGIRRTQELANKTFEEIFSYSLVQVYESQAGVASNPLKGRTFLVLSEIFNRDGLKQLRAPGSKYVDFGNKCYIRQTTCDDGACPLHALLGKKKAGGEYKMERAKEIFASVLRRRDETASRETFSQRNLPAEESPERRKDAIESKILMFKSGLASLRDFRGLLLDHRIPFTPGIIKKKRTSFVTAGETQSAEVLKSLLPTDRVPDTQFRTIA